MPRPSNDRRPVHALDARWHNSDRSELSASSSAVPGPPLQRLAEISKVQVTVDASEHVIGRDVLVEAEIIKQPRRLVHRKPDEPSKRRVELQPFDQFAAPSGSNREAATAPRAATAPAEWTGARRPCKALKTPGRARRALHRSLAASPAKDASSVFAPRCRYTRTTPRSSDPRLA
jgi:hypothetical protein